MKTATSGHGKNGKAERFARELEQTKAAVQAVERADLIGELGLTREQAEAVAVQVRREATREEFDRVRAAYVPPKPYGPRHKAFLLAWAEALRAVAAARASLGRLESARDGMRPADWRREGLSDNAVGTINDALRGGDWALMNLESELGMYAPLHVQNLAGADGDAVAMARAIPNVEGWIRDEYLALGLDVADEPAVEVAYERGDLPAEVVA